ncbi:MAG: DUF4150 domain-containing protein [Planctomycetes bacterium]|nr:DUF4150 domain-containing protein [Planctomycetota bacterium]
MANQVFANGREISCKAAAGQSAAAFPDTCWSPPPPIAGPVPVPYPNTAFSSDTSNGTRTVHITDKEVMIKDTSYFSTSTGDEPATNALGQGLVTGVIKGKAYFVAWSPDVILEGDNAVRHLDMMTHNHASAPGNTPPWLYADSGASGGEGDPCADDKKKVEEKCDPWKEKSKCPDTKKIQEARKRMAEAKAKHGDNSPEHIKAKAATEKAFEEYADAIAESECHTALRCRLSPYKPSKCCKTGQTGHHLVEASGFFKTGRGGEGSEPLPGCGKYNTDKAPCICAEGPSQTVATHGLMHTFQANATLTKMQKRNPGKTLKQMQAENTDKVTYKEAKEEGVKAVGKVFPASGCAEKCLIAQLDDYHNKQGIDDDTQTKAVVTGRTSDKDVEKAGKEVERRNTRSGGNPR